MTVMVSKAPGPHKIHGHMVDYKIVDEADVDALLADGWHLTPTAAGEAHAAELEAQKQAQESEADDKAAATRDEIEDKLTQLGVTFDRRLGTKKLLALVEDTLKQRAG